MKICVLPGDGIGIEIMAQAAQEQDRWERSKVEFGLRARVLDAHEPTGAPRDLCGEFEEVADAACLHRFGAGLDRRRLQHSQDKSIDAFPPRVRVDVDDRDGKLGDA